MKCYKEHEEDCINYHKANSPIYAEKIHPNLLKGLIPINTPVFIGIDGKERACRIEEFNFHSINFCEFTIDDMHLINSAITKAKEEGWEYLYCICQAPQRTTGHRYFIRGC